MQKILLMIFTLAFITACSKPSPLQELKVIRQLPTGDRGIQGLTFSPDGSKLLIGGYQNTQVFDTTTLAPVFETMPKLLEETRGGLWISENSLLVVEEASQKEKNRYYQIDFLIGTKTQVSLTSEMQTNLLATANGLQITDLYSHDKKTLATTEKGGLGLFDIASNEYKFKVQNASDIRAMAFSPNDQYMVLATFAMYRIIETKSGNVLWTKSTRGGASVVTGKEKAVAFTPDGKYLIIGEPSSDILNFYGVPSGKTIF